MHTEPPTPIKAADVHAGDDLAIYLGGAVAYNAVTVEHLFGTVAEARPKALRLQLDPVQGKPRSLWLPRRALVRVARDRTGVRAELARWWRPDDYQGRTLDACRHLGSLDVAC